MFRGKKVLTKFRFRFLETVKQYKNTNYPLITHEKVTILTSLATKLKEALGSQLHRIICMNNMFFPALPQ